MRLTLDRIDAPAPLQKAFLRLQDGINKLLARLPFEYAERIDHKFTTVNLPIVLTHHMPRPAWGLHHVYLRNLTTDTTVPAQAVHIDWIPDGGGVKIRSISGLTAGQLYEIRLIAYA